MRWRIVKSGKLSPAENMALDEAIMQGIITGKSEPTIRFYDWDPPTLSFGYHQSFENEIDTSEADKFGFGYIRRPTGGRLVLHKEEITYSVISPLRERLSGNITETYSEISFALAKGLQILGIDVEFERGNLASHHQREAANPCFSSTSRFELSYRKKKIVGSAQTRKDGVLLQHGSILLNFNQSEVAFVLPKLTLPQKKKLADYLSRKTVAINEILPEKVSYNEAIDAFIKGFIETWESDEFYLSEDFSDIERENAENLILTKYGTIEWNKRK
ncbi:MAG: octanoyltransferase [Candidatus Cloacimonadota bacterium]|nr:MAG: octanoyltransferase [Candidatus Cloacimonadota bacterium]